MILFSTMTSTIKGIVSKNKIRYKEDGFDLDLSYISKNIIAMGFPAEKLERFFRNHIDDVVKFFNDKHPHCYKIYNLCSEEKRKYDTTKFHGPVIDRYSFPDHNPPPFIILKPFCDDLHAWLTANKENVAGIHCKAGKGRTGVMICTYLVHAGGCELENGRGRAAIPDADAALEYYGRTRTHDHKGVTIPSQKRYVYYYDDLVKRKLDYRLVTLKLSSFTLSTVPNTNGGAFTLICEIYEIPKRKIATLEVDVKKGAKFVHFALNQDVFVVGDIKFAFYAKTKIKREKLFQFWINTFFVEHGTDSCVIAIEPCRKCSNPSNAVSVAIGQSFNSSAPSAMTWSQDRTKSTEQELESNSNLTTTSTTTTSSSLQAKSPSVIDLSFFKDIYSLKNTSTLCKNDHKETEQQQQQQQHFDRFCDCNNSSGLPATTTTTSSTSGSSQSNLTCSQPLLTATDISDALNRLNHHQNSNQNGKSCNGHNVSKSTGASQDLASSSSSTVSDSNPSLNHPHSSSFISSSSAASSTTATFSSSSSTTSFSTVNTNSSSTKSSFSRPSIHQVIVEQRSDKTYELANKDLFLVIPKHKLDKAFKDKSSKTFSPDFNVILNFVPTLNSSGSSEGRKLSNECYVSTYSTNYCVNYDIVSSSETETDDDESDNDVAAVCRSLADTGICSPQNRYSVCSQNVLQNTSCTKKSISGLESTHL